MTERTNLAHSRNTTELDPLDELARIVAGGGKRPLRQWEKETARIASRLQTAAAPIETNSSLSQRIEPELDPRDMAFAPLQPADEGDYRHSGDAANDLHAAEELAAEDMVSDQIADDLADDIALALESSEFEAELANEAMESDLDAEAFDAAMAEETLNADISEIESGAIQAQEAEPAEFEASVAFADEASEDEELSAVEAAAGALANEYRTETGFQTAPQFDDSIPDAVSEAEFNLDDELMHELGAGFADEAGPASTSFEPSKSPQSVTGAAMAAALAMLEQNQDRPAKMAVAASRPVERFEPASLEDQLLDELDQESWSDASPEVSAYESNRPSASTEDDIAPFDFAAALRKAESQLQAAAVPVRPMQEVDELDAELAALDNDFSPRPANQDSDLVAEMDEFAQFQAKLSDIAAREEEVEERLAFRGGLKPVETAATAAPKSEAVSAESDPFADFEKLLAQPHQKPMQLTPFGQVKRDTAFAQKPIAEAVAQPVARTVAQENDFEAELEAAFAEEFEPDFDDGQIAASTAAPRRQPTPRELEDEFASAFAEELDIEPQYSNQRHVSHGNGYTDPVIDEELEQYDQQQMDELPLGGNSRRGFITAAAALAVALTLGLAAASYAYFSGGSELTAGDNPMVIKADSDPVKIKPKEEQSAEAASQDKPSYERVSGSFSNDTKQENLVDDAENPVDLNAASKVEERVTAGAAATEETVQGDAVVQPRRVKTLTVRPDGTIVEQKIDDQVVNTTEVALAATAETTGAVKNVEAVARSVVKAVEETQASVGGAVDKAVEVASTSETAGATTPALSEWAVQVSSQKSAEDAQASYSNLRKRFPNLLEGRQMAVQRADVDGKGTFFRVRIQSASKEDADGFCAQLKKAGGSCFVTR